MARFLAFALLVAAAFDWPLPWLDRPGTAALGLGFLALGVGAASTGVRRALPFRVSPKMVDVADAPADELSSLVERIAAYEP